MLDANLAADPKPVVCSFCSKERHLVTKMVAGPGVFICDACVALCARVLTDKPTVALAGRPSLTEDELLATLPAAAAAVGDAENSLREHVDAVRRKGTSWERIAAVLGVSRQAAWARFSSES